MTKPERIAELQNARETLKAGREHYYSLGDNKTAWAYEDKLVEVNAELIKLGS